MQTKLKSAWNFALAMQLSFLVSIFVASFLRISQCFWTSSLKGGANGCWCELDSRVDCSFYFGIFQRWTFTNVTVEKTSWSMALMGTADHIMIDTKVYMTVGV